MASERRKLYRPGQGFVISCGSLGVVVDEVEGQRLDRLWNVVHEGGTIAEVLDVLARDGLGSLPSFGVLRFDSDSVRVLLRGSVTVRVSMGSEVEVISASDVTTWREVPISDPDRIELLLPDSSVTSDCLPLVAGVVMGSSLSWSVPSRGMEREAESVKSLGPQSDETDASELVSPQSVRETAPLTRSEDGSEEPIQPVEPIDVETDLGATVHPPPEDSDGVRSSSTVELDPEPDPELEHVDSHESQESGAADGPQVYAYDHLFGRTVSRSVEAAAVRPTETDSGDLIGSGNAQGAVAQSRDAGHKDQSPDADGDALAKSTASNGVAPDVPGPGQPSELIDGVLDGEAPALGDQESASEASPASEPSEEMHDGLTISRAWLKLEAGADEPETQEVNKVLASECPSGHLNAPHAATCRVCGEDVSVESHVRAPMPVLGRLTFSDGSDVLLDRPSVVGRAPKASNPIGGELPRLVRVSSPEKDVSRSHLQVRVKGWQVTVTDLDSANGTVVNVPGRDPQRLSPGRALSILPGVEVTLAEEVSFTYEAT